MSDYTYQLAGNLNKKLGEIPSVFDFGAVGDGTTDDSTAFINGIASVQASGGTGGGSLLVPGGYTFLISSPLTISGPMTLVGDGATSVIKRGADMLVSGSPTVGLINITGNNVVLADFQIEGNVTTAAGVNYSTLATGSYDPMMDVLVKNTSVWIKPGASGVQIANVLITHTGGYAILIDSRTADVADVSITGCRFINNRPHLFGFDPSQLSFGSWTGGIHYQGDCRTSAGHLYIVKNLLIDGCTFRRSTGNQVWGHAYGFDTLHSNIRVTNNYFEDIGRDCIELAVTSGGSVSGNKARRVGYITTSDGSASTPKYLAGQYAVFIDTSGCQGVDYTNNAAVSVHGAFFDLDGFAYGIVADNVCRVPQSGEIEYSEDSVSSWAAAVWNGSSTTTTAGNYTYGVQTANNYFTPGGSNVAVLNNTFVNCKAGAIRLFAARGCHISGNTINHPATYSYAPVIIGNFLPASGAGQTDSYNNSIVGNNIQWSPGSAAAVIQELASWSGSAINWGSTEKNWVADNRLFGNGNAYEFQKDSLSGSTTSTMLSSQSSAISASASVTMSREAVSGVHFTSQYAPNGDLQWRFLDALGQFNVSLNGANGSVTTGSRAGALAVDDTVATGHLYGDGFLCLTNTTYVAADADTFVDTYGLIRYNSSSKKFEQSNSTSGGHRVWSDLVASTSAAGSSTHVQYNSSGSFAGSANFTWDNTNKILTLADTGSSSGLVVNGSSSAAVNVPNGTVQANNLTTKNSVYLVETSAPSTAAGIAILYSSSSTHKLLLSLNNGAFANVATETWVTSQGYLTSGSFVAGSNQQVQFNNSGAFGASSNLTWDGTNLTTTSGMVTATFNSSATGSTHAVQQASGNFYITGAGDANFQSCAVTNNVIAGGTIRSDVTGATHAFQTQSGGTSYITGAGDAAFQSVVATNAFNSTATGANAAFLTNNNNVIIYGNGQIGGQWYAAHEQSSAPAGAASYAVFYTKTDHLLYVKLNNGSEDRIATASYISGLSYTTLAAVAAVGYITSSYNGALSSLTSITASGNIISSGTIRSDVTGSTHAFQTQAGGTSYITGDGDAYFQSATLTHKVDISGSQARIELADGTGAGGVAGKCVIAFNGTNLLANINNSGWNIII